MGERRVRNAEVMGSNPTISTDVRGGSRGFLLLITGEDDAKIQKLLTNSAKASIIELAVSESTKDAFLLMRPIIGSINS